LATDIHRILADRECVAAPPTHPATHHVIFTDWVGWLNPPIKSVSRNSVVRVGFRDETRRYPQIGAAPPQTAQAGSFGSGSPDPQYRPLSAAGRRFPASHPSALPRFATAASSSTITVGVFTDKA
jgi:hypothetical protein